MTIVDYTLILIGFALIGLLCIPTEKLMRCLMRCRWLRRFNR